MYNQVTLLNTVIQLYLNKKKKIESLEINLAFLVN